MVMGQTFTATDSEQPFPVDLGASWIHGIDSNPLAAMALKAKVAFVRTSEEVTMLREGRATIYQSRDQHAGEIFDKLLDLAVSPTHSYLTCKHNLTLCSMSF